MENLESYLKNVARFLPAADRDDIVRELAENLRSQIEDREAEIGRPLTEAEGTALLDRFGTPLEVAARYRPASGVLAFGPVLVGPVLFPFYAKLLAFLLGLTACAIVVIGAALRVPSASVVQALLIHLAIQFAIVTLIFSIAQVSLARRPRLFDVSLPLRYIAAPETAAVPRVSRLESGSEIVLLAILLAWLPALRGYAREWIGEAGLAPAPVWGQVYVAIACLWVAGILRAAIAFVRPEWVRFRSVARSVLDMAWLAIVGVLLMARAWFAPLAHAATPAGADPGVAAIVNHWLFIGLVVVAVASAFQVLVDLRRLISRKYVARAVVLAAGVLCATQARAQAPVAALPSDAEIRQALAQRVDRDRRAIGMVVGIVSPAGRRVVAYGSVNSGDARTPDGDTVFEIGSVTKTFTGLPFWPTGVPAGEEGAAAMSTYALPRLYDFLGSYELTRDIGSKWEYSNLGYGLLGHALARRAKMDYPQLVRARITAPWPRRICRCASRWTTPAA